MQKELLLNIGISLIAALIISFLATPLVMELAKKVGAIDVPADTRRVHNHPIPRLGGLAILLGFLLSVILFAKIDMQLRGILIGAVIIATVGAIDDVVPLPALLKFILQILAAVVAVLHGVVITIVSNPNILGSEEYLRLSIFSIPITILWIVAITNSVNLIDGLDGLAVGVSTIATISMLVIALLVSEGNVAVVLAALAGACLGFMPYNLNPAKIFMGDTGALLLGYILATMSIVGLFKFYAIISFAVPFLIVGLPLFDTASAFIRRIAHGKNPMSPDREHFHHKLIDLGFSQKQAVAILYAISAVLGLCAVVITTSGEIRAAILIVAICVALIIGYFSMKHKKKNEPEQKNDSEDVDEQ